MKYGYFALSAFGCVLFALLGLTAGINLNPASTVKFVPDWGSLADWVAGFGSLAAVFATILIGWQQRQDLLPRLSLKTSGAVAMLGHTPINIFALKLANPGHVPIEVKGVFISSEVSDQSLWISPEMLMPGSDRYPAVVAPGKGLTFHFDRHALSALKSYVSTHCGGQNSGLRITVTGSVRDFSIELDPKTPLIA